VTALTDAQRRVRDDSADALTGLMRRLAVMIDDLAVVPRTQVVRDELQAVRKMMHVVQRTLRNLDQS
jgi:hypothetical protein